MKDDDAPQQWKINNAYDKLLAGINGLKDIGNLVFFVDCGDHGRFYGNLRVMTFGRIQFRDGSNLW